MTTPWRLRLYLAGTPADEADVAEQLRDALRDHPDVHWEIVDVVQNPTAAREADLLTCPTLVRLQPEPEVRFIGDFGDAETVAAALGLPRGGAGPSEGQR